VKLKIILLAIALNIFGCTQAKDAAQVGIIQKERHLERPRETLQKSNQLVAYVDCMEKAVSAAEIAKCQEMKAKDTPTH
jgi:hypothetical protein